jgi:hypothetical protein
VNENYQPPLFEHAPVEERVEYELLKGHYRTDKTFKSDEQLKMQYVELTDELVRQMTDGVIVTDSETREPKVEKPDYVVWLDKSARPVAWLTKELWPTLAEQPDGEVPKMPDFRFVNIDREQWVNDIDPNGTGKMDVSLIAPGVIRSLRSLFMNQKYKREGLTEAIDTAPTEFDDKTVLIVDEVHASGRTLDIARKFFERAFPKARFADTHWMQGVVYRDGATGNADLPVWYREDTDKGRGVGNRDERISQASKSRTQRLGSWFLSTRFPEADQSSQKLRRELKQLARDVEEHRVLVVPSWRREDEDYVARAERLNEMDFDTFKQTKLEKR